MIFIGKSINLKPLLISSWWYAKSCCCKMNEMIRNSCLNCINFSTVVQNVQTVAAGGEGIVTRGNLRLPAQTRNDGSAGEWDFIRIVWWIAWNIARSPAKKSIFYVTSALGFACGGPWLVLHVGMTLESPPSWRAPAGDAVQLKRRSKNAAKTRDSHYCAITT